MNKIFLTGRIYASGKTEKGMELMVKTYCYEPDEMEYIPVVINDKSRVYIRDFRNGNLISVVGKLRFKKGIVKVIAEQVNFAG